MMRESRPLQATGGKVLYYFFLQNPTYKISSNYLLFYSENTINLQDLIAWTEDGNFAE
jgi:hypothetical protein